MKKILFLTTILLLLTGCTIVRIDTDSIDNTIDVVLSKENNLFNQVGKGYKYYIPRGVSYIDTSGFNDILYSEGNNYYLYIDAISYYYKIQSDYQINEKAYFSKSIVNGDKFGYLEINEQKNGKYYIEFMYNYAKIEALVTKNDINNVIVNASYILSTIKFNNNVIKVMLDNEFLVNEEKYDIFSSKQETNDFLKIEDEVNQDGNI